MVSFGRELPGLVVALVFKSVFLQRLVGSLFQRLARSGRLYDSVLVGSRIDMSYWQMLCSEKAVQMTIPV